MSNHDNHRLGEKKRSEHGPRYESHDPGAGCNSTHVARGRKKYKQRKTRAVRRSQDVLIAAELKRLEDEIWRKSQER